MEGSQQQQEMSLPSPKRFKYIHNPSASSTFSPTNMILLPSTSMTPLSQPTPSSLSNNINTSTLQNKIVAPFSATTSTISNATTTIPIPSILPNHSALLSLAANAAQTQQFNLLSNGLPIKKLSKGCSCKKSTCIKGYCECFNNGQYCSKNCKCTSCKNYVNSVELKKVREKTISQQNESVQVLAAPQPATLPNHILNLQIFNSNQQKLGTIPLQQQHQVFIDLNRNHGREMMKAMLTSDFPNIVARHLMNTAIATKEEIIKRGENFSSDPTPSSPITPTVSSSSANGDKLLGVDTREVQQKASTAFDNTISLECEEDDALDSTKPVNNDTKFASVPITPPPQAFDSSIFFTSPTREFLSPPRSKPTTNETPLITAPPVPDITSGTKISEADLQATIQQAVLQEFKNILDRILETVKEQPYASSLLHQHGAK